MSTDRQFIKAKILQYGDSFGRRSFYPVWVAEAYELQWIDVADGCVRLVDAGILGCHKNGRYFWL